jgi:hypothetical protein
MSRLGLIPASVGAVAHRFIGPRSALRFMDLAAATRRNNDGGSFSASTLRVYPIYLQGSTTLDRIAVEVTTAGDAAARIRLGFVRGQRKWVLSRFTACRCGTN